jgi:hypothetical protein
MWQDTLKAWFPIPICFKINSCFSYFFSFINSTFDILRRIKEVDLNIIS